MISPSNDSLDLRVGSDVPFAHYASSSQS